MRKPFWMFALAFVCVLALACSQESSNGFTENPAAPVAEQSELANVTAGVRSNDFPVLLCHHNADFETEGGFEWHVIEVDNNSVNRHVANHGDFTTGTCSGLGTLLVEDDCGCCTGLGCDVF